MYIFIFLLILSFLVIIHELGHMLTALLFKVKVEEFGLGIPPKVRTLFTWRGILFTLNAFPLGGFVRMDGEEGNSEGGEGNAEKKSGNALPFYSIPAWQRLIVVLAGATVNFIFGVFAFTIIFSIVGIPEKTAHPQIAVVVDGSPAHQAGILVDDTIIGLKAKPEDSSISITTMDEFVQKVKEHKGNTILLSIMRDGKSLELPVYVRTDDQIPSGEGAVGVALQQNQMKRYPWYEMPFRASKVGLLQSLEFGRMIVQSLGSMVQDIVVKGQPPANVSGPVGIAYQAGRESLFSQGPLMILNFAALLSINLAIMNVLPLPALDGGRALFILLEKILPTKIRGRVEHAIHSAGFLFLITLIILITLKDIFVIVRDVL